MNIYGRGMHGDGGTSAQWASKGSPEQKLHDSVNCGGCEVGYDDAVEDNVSSIYINLAPYRIAALMLMVLPAKTIDNRVNCGISVIYDSDPYLVLSDGTRSLRPEQNLLSEDNRSAALCPSAPVARLGAGARLQLRAPVNRWKAVHCSDQR